MCKTSVYASDSNGNAINPIKIDISNNNNINGANPVNSASGWSTNQRRGRLLPIEEVNGPNGWEDGVDRDNHVSIPPFENTRHRYPWICSLRYVAHNFCNPLCNLLLHIFV